MDSRLPSRPSSRVRREPASANPAPGPMYAKMKGWNMSSYWLWGRSPTCQAQQALIGQVGDLPHLPYLTFNKWNLEHFRMLNRTVTEIAIFPEQFSMIRRDGEVSMFWRRIE